MKVNQADFIEDTLKKLKSDDCISHGLTRSDIKILIQEYRDILAERNEARANARILAHSFSTDNRPPRKVVADSLKYAINQHLSQRNKI